MWMPLHNLYKEVYNKGWTTDSYTKWRGQVIQRINKLYKTNYRNLTDGEIFDYIERAKFYKE